MRVSTTTR